MEHHCLALPILNVFRKLTFVYRGVTSSVQRLLWNNVLNMSCNLQNTVLKVKTSNVVEVQYGCKCIDWDHVADWELPLPSLRRE